MLYCGIHPSRASGTHAFLRKDTRFAVVTNPSERCHASRRNRLATRYKRTSLDGACLASRGAVI